MPRRAIRSSTLVASLALVTSACASGNFVGGSSGTPAASSRPVPSAQPAPRPTFRTPQVMRGSGVESVIGAEAGALLDRFGGARIDLVEGDARKLQFASDSCVLDIFLYPLEEGRAPVATHIEARQRQGRGAADPGQCITEVERAR